MDDDRTTSDTEPTHDGPGPTPEDIKTEPPGNPPVDEDAKDEGEDKLGRVKPY